jgi:hypothetical protein
LVRLLSDSGHFDSERQMLLMTGQLTQCLPYGLSESCRNADAPDIGIAADELRGQHARLTVQVPGRSLHDFVFWGLQHPFVFKYTPVIGQHPTDSDRTFRMIVDLSLEGPPIPAFG